MTERRDRTLIAAHDGSPRGLAVVARGRRIAEKADARLLIVHVIENQTPYWAGDPDHQHRLRTELEHIFEPARAVGGPRAETRAIGARSVVEGLLGVIEDEKAGVIVIGRSHHGPVGHMLYGDVAHQIERRCDCYVDVTPIEVEAEAAAAA